MSLSSFDKCGLNCLSSVPSPAGAGGGGVGTEGSATPVGEGVFGLSSPICASAVVSGH